MLAYGSGDSVQYIYNNFGRVTKETCDDNDTLTYRYNPLRITYDANGPLYVDYNGTIYYYVTNLQGDVIALVNTSGTPVVEYTYDAWGSILTTTGSMATTLGAHNPLRYRSYVYDTELGLYYLQSRYYDPVMGRFINADALAATGQGLTGNNMFAYCGNNPVVYCDNFGYFRDICITCMVDGGSSKLNAPSINKPAGLFSTSLGISASIGVGPFIYGAQIALVTDSTGYSEVQATYYVPISTAAVAETPALNQMLSQAGTVDTTVSAFTFSIMGNVSVYNAPFAENLHDIGYQVGGTFGKGNAIAVDGNFIPNGTNSPYNGITISSGLGAWDAHGVMGITVPVFTSPVSVFDIVTAAYNGVWGIN